MTQPRTRARTADTSREQSETGGVYELNPLTGLLVGFRWSMLGTGRPEWGWVVYSVITSVAVFVAGAYAFKSLEKKFADVI